LYFVGAGTHPGAGLPGVLSSSIIADDLISGGEFVTQTNAARPAQPAFA
jgi:phytoene dehydrogenase-like protein